MTTPPMHADELPIDETLVRRMLAERFPTWAAEPLSRVASAGTDNALFRLGDRLVVRVPRIASAATSIEKEHRWLPRLAASLPLRVPEPVALGEPAAGYPWRWSVYRWLDGENPSVDDLADPEGFAATLGRFVRDLEAVDPADGPGPGEHNAWRGCALADRDEETRAAIHASRSLDGFDATAVTRAWEDALAVAPSGARAVWVHGDLLPTNLLVRDGELSAVIDFACLGVGEPTCDVMPAWTTVPRRARAAFREAVETDDATWARGRGWALSWAVVALPYYVETNPILASIARRTIEAVLADPER